MISSFLLDLIHWRHNNSWHKQQTWFGSFLLVDQTPINHIFQLRQSPSHFMAQCQKNDMILVVQWLNFYSAEQSNTFIITRAFISELFTSLSNLCSRLLKFLKVKEVEMCLFECKWNENANLLFWLATWRILIFNSSTRMEQIKCAEFMTLILSPHSL